MPSIAVVGLQWGDEGKGKVVDVLSDNVRYVIRSQGGHNAAHTIKIEDEELQLHHIPAGICRENTICYIGGGCVIDPKVLIEELELLQTKQIDYNKRLFLSPYAHVIFPYHRIIDEMESKWRKNEVNEKGIGPCYADKVQRFGIRMADLLSPEFEEKIAYNLKLKNEILEKIFHFPPLEMEQILFEYQRYGSYLKDLIKDKEGEIAEAIACGEPVIFEGAQGALLDLTFGSYPYVTSSSTVAAGLCAGCGAGPTRIDHTLGVVKAYTSHVGKGPFPTVFNDKEQKLFPSNFMSREIGANIGRLRQVGWFDSVLVRHALRVNGVDSLALMKLDILDDLDKIKICVGYKIGQKEMKTPPILWEDAYKAVPLFEEVEGWKTSTKNVTIYEDLPKKAQFFLEKLRQICGVPINIISVGPERQQTIIRNQFFN